MLPGDRNLAVAVFLVLLAAYLATFSGLPDNPDAEVEFQTTSALVRGQTLALGGTPEADAIVSVVHQGRQGFNVRPGGPGREHQYFGWSGVGQALAAFPFYLVGTLAAHLLPELEQRHAGTTHLGFARSEYLEHAFVGLRNPLLGALTGALVLIAARRAGARRAHAFLAGLSYGLCTLAWPQARGTMSDVQATALLFLAFVLMQGQIERVERNHPIRVLPFLGFGLALGGAFLTRSVLAPAVAVLGLWTAVELVRSAHRFPWRELSLAFAPAILCFQLFLLLNWLRFGDVLESGYGGVVDAGWFRRSPLPGLLGAGISPGSGIAWFAPGILLLVPWVTNRIGRREYSLLVLLGGLVLAIGLPAVVIPSWHGAWSYGPRYLLPLLPFLWFPIGMVLGIAAEWPPLRWIAVGLLGLGLVTALPGALVEYNTNLDLTLQAARLEWPGSPGDDPAVAEEERFVRTKFEWRYAAPWAHWRILRHRVAGLGEEFPVRELYFLDRDDVVRPQWERERGFRHLFWVDLKQRLGGPAWPGPVLVLALLALGALFTIRGLDPDQP